MNLALTWLLVTLFAPTPAQAAPSGCVWSDGGLIVFSAEPCSKDQQALHMCQGNGRTWFVPVGSGC